MANTTLHIVGISADHHCEDGLMTGSCKQRHDARATDFARFFIKDESGVISVMAAFSLVMVIAIAAIVVDAGSMMLTRRGLQNATDAAALSAAQHLPDGAAAAVAEALQKNGYSLDDIDLVETGVYEANEAKSAGDRFTAAIDPSDPEINAVRVRTKAQAATYFARALGLDSFSTVRTKATAAVIATASFSAGTRLAQLDGGIANQVLGGLLGSSLSLSVIDYQALANARVGSLRFLDAVAARANIQEKSYGYLLDQPVSVDLIFEAIRDVLEDSASGSTGNISGAISALNTLAQLPQTKSMKLRDVLSTPSIEARTIGGITGTDSDTQFEVYALVAAMARSMGAGKKIDVNTGLTIPVTNTSVQASIAIGAPKAQVANGPVGTKIHTSQVNIGLTVQLLKVNLGLVSGKVTVPIYIYAAPGEATINAIPCRDEKMVTIGGTTGAVVARYGDAGATLGTDFPATVSDPVIVDLKVGVPNVLPFLPDLTVSVPVTASGSANVASGSGSVDFSKAEIGETDPPLYKSIIGSDSGTLFSDLSGALRLTIGDSSLMSLVSNLLSGLLTTVSGAVSLLDEPVKSLLQALGLKLGVMDVSVSGAKCGVPVLVG